MKLKNVLVATVASSALVLAGCSGGGGGEEKAPGTDGETTATSLMLNWYPYGEHAPFYYGVQEGIFAEHGIDLTITAGQGSTKTAQAAGSNQTDFGWADTAAVMSNIDKGVKVKSLGVFLQTTPSAVQVYADGPIQTTADLAGKTIAVSAGDAPTTTFPIFLDRAGVSEDQVQQQSLDSAGKIAAMLSGQVDGLIGFAHDQGPNIANKSGREMRYLRYSDEGLNFYSNGLIANTSTIERSPELVQAMVDATRESFEAAIANPEAAVASMVGKDPQTPPESVLLQQWQETIPLLTTENTEGMAPGVNSDQDWANTIGILSDAGLTETGAEASTYWDSSFTSNEE
ncbi:ABC transporter substrate-binding protein [Rhodococcus fascians]|uniref:ABC transporter substrate-binding protein n=1 Tax=Rhodococcoides fascians TaxID=1828 RepID=UPI00050CBEF4|nr:ABC transporter substrate-binding protein [Rhodococcus fascians]MBM7245142.1 ABC transporter substrate-binding protein [Rhodococcus fascians]MBY3811109.1 ABC transporter substrate-binding protein [Rhodococcus fascians]MBY3842612.1 ABC transporter substrate-binding protein [Rhodococcus fascians]MBY3845521.1 ABC transporter substrate-binding protein [Rhodococcus fascians]MBY3851747.1 ABC transporter substrate-binding protein [Rhodococcus fascians]